MLLAARRTLAVPCRASLPCRPRTVHAVRSVYRMFRVTHPGLALAQLTHHFFVLFSMRAVLVEVEEQETKSVQNTLMRAIAYSLHPHMPVRIKVA